MKIVEQIKIQNNSDTLYAKTTLRNHLKWAQGLNDKSFLIFALMELATNLVKHGGGGEIWILKSEDEIFVAALDYGKGIQDLKVAMQKGTTSMQNSLGLGLYQLNQNPLYQLEIFTLTEKKLHGTIVLVTPKQLKKSILSLKMNYIDEEVSGDLFVQKGKFALLADGSGHGKKANQTVEFIKNFFYNNHFSCLLIHEFFQSLHQALQEKALRSAVLTLFEITRNSVQACGIGNISLWHHACNQLELFNQKSGIIGEAFSSYSQFTFALNPGERILATTDGIDNTAVKEISSHLHNQMSSALCALILVHFASVKYDDKTVVVIEKPKEEVENDPRV